MELLGGLLIEGELHRSFRFKPVTGALELGLASVPADSSHPERVTSVLVAALDSLCGARPEPERIRALSVGDRQFLMRELATHLDAGPVWLTARCGRCDEPFDVSITLSELPTKAAGEGFPRSELELSGRRVFVRAPTGEDQERLARLSAAEAEQALLGLLVEPVGSDSWALDELDAAEVERVEAAVEELTPEVGEEAVARCPGCESENALRIDIYGALDHAPIELFSDVHVLATHYHWSEAEILALPRERRRAYRDLVDRSRGLFGADAVLAEARA